MSGLHQAALMGNTEIMELLLEHGALVSTRDNKGEIIKLKWQTYSFDATVIQWLMSWKLHFCACMQRHNNLCDQQCKPRWRKKSI